jgi:hypothetical protein
MMNIMFFSICTARKKLAWLRVQSLMKALIELAGQRTRHPRRHEEVVELQAHAGNPVIHAVQALRVGEVDQRQAAVVLVHADLEQPTTVKVFRRGTTPAGVTTPCGAISVTRSPTKTPSARASSEPRMMLKLSGCKASSWPLFMCGRKSATRSSWSGRMPRTSAPRTDCAVGQHALRLHEGRGGEHVRLSGGLLATFPSRPSRRRRR